jgi:uncharacterized membrane protein
MNEWFNSNMLPLNYDKTCHMKFSAKHDCTNTLRIKYNNTNLLETNNVKFLGMILDNTISWEKHIESLKSKLNKACYIMRKSKQHLSITAFKMVYYAFFHSIITYGLIFWGNTTNSVQVFKLQKRVIRIMVGAADSCKKIFRSSQILPLPSLYIYYLVMYIVNNLELFVLNFDRNISATRNSMNLYLPIANLRVFQKSPEFFGIKVYNNLPGNTKQSRTQTMEFIYIYIS